jgi:hypothetical protein
MEILEVPSKELNFTNLITKRKNVAAIGFINVLLKKIVIFKFNLLIWSR